MAADKACPKYFWIALSDVVEEGSWNWMMKIVPGSCNPDTGMMTVAKKTTITYVRKQTDTVTVIHLSDIATVIHHSDTATGGGVVIIGRN
ncbi:hypothetical protein MAR_018048 [Mya arenaria]|uniref:Uncharacterized protein n=1 Tax=Mya arenaria TaxID=6604 RepID=A0ABY7EDI9_MYAAR|nr:hypothetical protein MAR_018048 [Mya arenaria]